MKLTQKKVRWLGLVLLVIGVGLVASDRVLRPYALVAQSCRACLRVLPRFLGETL